MKTSKKGFTLLELLIVITIISVLSVIIIVVINPAETLRKARDTQRMSDMSSLKTALGIYTTTVSSPDLDASVSACLGTNITNARISYSSVQTTTDGTTCTDAGPTLGADATGALGGTGAWCRTLTTSSAAAAVDGTGWIPVNLTAITGGSPISNLPLDPINSTFTANPTRETLAYRYACQNAATSPKPSFVFTIASVLESAALGPGGTDDRSAKDGGSNINLYEVGTNLKLIIGSNPTTDSTTTGW